MSKDKAATIYARTLLESAGEQKVLETVTADVQALAAAFRELPRLARFLGNPIVPAQKKAALLDTAAQGFTPLTRKFLKLLEAKNRLGILRGVADEFIALEEAGRNIVRGVVVSASALAQDQIDMLAKGIEARRPGKKVLLTNQIDTSLIAGFRVQQGDIITDASIKHKLEQLKQKLAA